MSESENERIVARLWQALYAKDWDGVAALIGERGHYEDVPTPDPGATGPVNVVKRLRSGLDHVERFEHQLHRVVSSGDCVMLEHTEIWHFPTGEKLSNDFVTVHEVRGGKIQLWRDYWDLGRMMAQAPKWWIEKLAQHDASDWSD